MDALAEGRLDDDEEEGDLGIGIDDGLDDDDDADADDEEIFGAMDGPPASRAMVAEPEPEAVDGE